MGTIADQEAKQGHKDRLPQSASIQIHTHPEMWTKRAVISTHDWTIMKTSPWPLSTACATLLHPFMCIDADLSVIVMISGWHCGTSWLVTLSEGYISIGNCNNEAPTATGSRSVCRCGHGVTQGSQLHQHLGQSETF